MTGYWDGWYRTGGPPDVPSQFAVMVAAEMGGRVGRIVDFGCGTGRDTAILNLVAPTVGIDASPVAIETARRLHPECAFVCGSVDAVHGEGLLYARFLLHAVHEPVEDALLDRLVGRWAVAFEFRTADDIGRPKVTPEHYRRPVSLNELRGKLERRGFTVTYSVVGLGMARFGFEDAHVGRVLAERL
jgi:SAM-dependent methyltransferase